MPRSATANPSCISRRHLEGNGWPAMVHHRDTAPVSSGLRVPCFVSGRLRPILPRRARPTRPPPRGGAARLPHVRRKETPAEPRRNHGKKSTDLQHVVFETEEAGRVEAMWSSLRLNGQDVPDGWHRYAVRGGDDGWEPCSIEPFVWVNHTPTSSRPSTSSSTSTTGCSPSGTGGLTTSRSLPSDGPGTMPPARRGRRLQRPEDSYRPLDSNILEWNTTRARRRRT